jgi:AraC-like DNA-binding protein
MTTLAEKMGMARAYFSTRFKEEIGMAPHEYLTALRIQKACLLLESGEDHSIEEIAYLVGSDPKNFSRQFKQHTGKTPLEYKRMLGK